MNPKKMDVTVIQSAGGLIWRNTLTGKELAIIHRPKYNDWTLPKGKLEPGETWIEAAMREAREETSCDVEIESFAGCVCYRYHEIPKIVLYWNMRLIGECHFQSKKEVDEIRWLKVEQALPMLDYQSERELILKITQPG